MEAVDHGWSDVLEAGLSPAWSRGGDLAAVDDEGLLELVVHLDQLAHGGVHRPRTFSSSAGRGAELAAGVPGVPVR
jgi:hypothetical protein